jgi:hypothetical protein
VQQCHPVQGVCLSKDAARPGAGLKKLDLRQSSGNHPAIRLVPFGFSVQVVFRDVVLQGLRGWFAATSGESLELADTLRLWRDCIE